MGVVRKAGDWTFKVFSAGLGVATIFFAATFSLNFYRGLSSHNRQPYGCFKGESALLLKRTGLSVIGCFITTMLSIAKLMKVEL